MKIVHLYNSICTALPAVWTLTEKQKAAVRRAASQLSEADFRTLFAKTEGSALLTGRAGNWKGADFDWLLRPENFAKVLSGKYDDKPRQRQTQPAREPLTVSSFDINELDRIDTLDDYA